MSLPKSPNTRDNEQNKFVNDSDNCVAVNTVSELKEGSFSDITGNSPTIYNVIMTTSGNEYTQALPVGVNKIKMKIKDNESKFEVSYVSSGPTWTVSRGSIYLEDGLDLSGVTSVYFKSNKDNVVMEIIAWT